MRISLESAVFKQCRSVKNKVWKQPERETQGNYFELKIYINLQNLIEIKILKAFNVSRNSLS